MSLETANKLVVEIVDIHYRLNCRKCVLLGIKVPPRPLVREHATITDAHTQLVMLGMQVDKLKKDISGLMTANAPLDDMTRIEAMRKGVYAAKYNLVTYFGDIP